MPEIATIYPNAVDELRGVIERHGGRLGRQEFDAEFSKRRFPCWLRFCDMLGFAANGGSDWATWLDFTQRLVSDGVVGIVGSGEDIEYVMKLFGRQARRAKAIRAARKLFRLRCEVAVFGIDAIRRLSCRGAVVVRPTGGHMGFNEELRGYFI